MDFDFNIILVPITLIFGLIWLLDIVWFKQHQRAKTRVPSQDAADADNVAPYLAAPKEAAFQAAQTHFSQQQDSYIALLTKHDIAYDAARLDAVVIDEAPLEVKQAQRDYRDAKRQFSIHSHAQSAKSAHSEKTRHEPFLIRLAHDYFPVLAVVLIVRSFIIEPFNIPSPSMVPALYTGDFVTVNKFAYGIRLPLLYKKIIATGTPQHGDVVVFRFPDNPSIYYIKRVIGLPGDTVSFNKGQLAINGDPVPSKQVNFRIDKVLNEQLYTPSKGQQAESIAKAEREESGAKYYQEHVGEHTYLRRYLAPSEPKAVGSDFLNSNVTQQQGSWRISVPEGQYFVMGDNSDRSGDSRFWGYVPDANLAGKASYVWMHKQPGLLHLPTFAYNRSID